MIESISFQISFSFSFQNGAYLVAWNRSSVNPLNLNGCFLRNTLSQRDCYGNSFGYLYWINCLEGIGVDITYYEDGDEDEGYISI